MELFPKEKLEWTRREKILIPWFQNLRSEERPKVPFKLTGYITVNGDGFYNRIEDSIKRGPDCYDSRYGLLEFNLEHLTKVLGEIVE